MVENGNERQEKAANSLLMKLITRHYRNLTWFYFGKLDRLQWSQ